MTSSLHIIGGGLAGTEAAWQAANLGVDVILYEMRPTKRTEVHKTGTLAELVCSNSFRSDDCNSNAVGVLHEEMRMMDSLIMQVADLHRVPAGGALAVDRELFAREIEKRIAFHPNITIKREEIVSLDNDNWKKIIIATGPLTADPLAEAIKAKTGEDDLAFFDAIAPIVYFDSVNMDIAWFQSRYDKGDGKDYINCPMNKVQYEAFIEALKSGDKMIFKNWEENTPYFDGCMPIEIMASRGIETLRFGPMKPVGLTNPHNKSRPYAVVQLRQDNKIGSLFNIVGFQTKLKYAEQKKIFRTIPGLEEAEFARLGGLHRNTFINSPEILSSDLSHKDSPNIYFAGQITGVEGYVESTAIGLLVAFFLLKRMTRSPLFPPPSTTALGSLHKYILTKDKKELYQPMNVNFGLFKGLEEKHKKKMTKDDRKLAYTTRAKLDYSDWLKSQATDP